MEKEKEVLLRPTRAAVITHVVDPEVMRTRVRVITIRTAPPRVKRRARVASFGVNKHLWGFGAPACQKSDQFLELI
eukprot:scaffold3240_cov187-Amphora_coffeaeformis.AAC.28